MKIQKILETNEEERPLLVGVAINIVRCIVCTMFCVLKNIVKNIDVDVFSKTSPKNCIVKEKARCFRFQHQHQHQQCTTQSLLLSDLSIFRVLLD